MRWTRGAVVAASLLMVGCAAEPTQAPLGESLAVEVRHADAEATAELTITEVTAHPVAELTPALQLAPEYRDGTVFLANYRVQVVAGEYPAESTYGFSEYNWTATGAHDAQVATLQAYHAVEIDGCHLFDRDAAVALAAGEPVAACTIFVSPQPDAELARITYGKPSISRRGADSGWHWTL